MSAEILMTIWVVYESPLDFPGKFVVRPQSIVRTAGDTGIWPHALHFVTDTIEQARKHVPPFLYCMPRGEESQGEDPAVAETWM